MKSSRDILFQKVCELIANRNAPPGSEHKEHKRNLTHSDHEEYKKRLTNADEMLKKINDLKLEISRGPEEKGSTDVTKGNIDDIEFHFYIFVYFYAGLENEIEKLEKLTTMKDINSWLQELLSHLNSVGIDHMGISSIFDKAFIDSEDATPSAVITHIGNTLKLGLLSLGNHWDSIKKHWDNILNENTVDILNSDLTDSEKEVKLSQIQEEVKAWREKGIQSLFYTSLESTKEYARTVGNYTQTWVMPGLFEAMVKSRFLKMMEDPSLKHTEKLSDKKPHECFRYFLKSNFWEISDPMTRKCIEQAREMMGAVGKDNEEENSYRNECKNIMRKFLSSHEAEFVKIFHPTIREDNIRLLVNDSSLIDEIYEDAYSSPSTSPKSNAPKEEKYNDLKSPLPAAALSSPNLDPPPPPPASSDNKKGKKDPHYLTETESSRAKRIEIKKKTSHRAPFVPAGSIRPTAPSPLDMPRDRSRTRSPHEGYRSSTFFSRAKVKEKKESGPKKDPFKPPSARRYSR